MVPDGGWSEPAKCLLYPNPKPNRRDEFGRHISPVSSCRCGWRVCVDIETAWEYVSPDLAGFPSVAHDLVLVRVETGERVIPCQHLEKNLTVSNCFVTDRVRPVWPGSRVNPDLATMLREHYGREDIYQVSAFSQGRHRGSKPRPPVDSGGPGGPGGWHQSISRLREQAPSWRSIYDPTNYGSDSVRPQPTTTTNSARGKSGPRHQGSRWRGRHNRQSDGQ
jgi:hypothetical protein